MVRCVDTSLQAPSGIGWTGLCLSKGYDPHWADLALRWGHPGIQGTGCFVPLQPGLGGAPQAPPRMTPVAQI